MTGVEQEDELNDEEKEAWGGDIGQRLAVPLPTPDKSQRTYV